MHTLLVRNLYVTADCTAGKTDIVRGLRFCADCGERLAIVGESGCGKTMTAMAITGTLPANCAESGEILLDGISLDKLSRRKLNAMRGNEIVYVPQSGAEFLNPSLKIGTQVTESVAKNGVPRNGRKRESFKRLCAAGLDNADEILEKYPFEISGGQAQKVVLAMSASPAAKLVIADEPTKGIDEEAAKRFLDGLDEIFGSAAIIVITHNISIAARTDKLLVMFQGEAVEFGPTEEILAQPFHPYTKSLIAALPENGLKADSEFVLPPKGKGCPYSGRCPKATPLCQSISPEEKHLGERMWRCHHA